MNIPPKYSVEIRRLDEDEQIAVRLASITVHGDAALARLLHGYAESVEDELPARQYDTDPPIIVRSEWFKKALDNKGRIHELEDRAGEVIRSNASPSAKLAALYILNGDESTRQELYGTEPIVVENSAGEIRVL